MFLGLVCFISENDVIFFVNSNSLTWEKVEELKQEHCYIAEDYHDELGIFEVVHSYLKLVDVGEPKISRILTIC